MLRLARRFASDANKATAFGREVQPVDKLLHQPKNDAEKQALSTLYGRPTSDLKRVAFIAVPAKSSMQSGRDMHRSWTVTFSKHDEEWRNPLMGWTSGKDVLKQVTLKFDDKESAVAFCERNGYDFEIEGERLAPPTPKAYASNFAYRPPRDAFDGTID